MSNCWFGEPSHATTVTGIRFWRKSPAVKRLVFKAVPEEVLKAKILPLIPVGPLGERAGHGELRQHERAQHLNRDRDDRHRVGAEQRFVRLADERPGQEFEIPKQLQHGSSSGLGSATRRPEMRII
jgi:hypothetical protein